MTCLLKRGLPFVLALITGLGAWALTERLQAPTLSTSIKVKDTVGTAVIIKHVPELQLTRAAIKSSGGFNGSIRLQALLGADGRVEEVKLVPMLPYGVTEESLDAAQRTESMPARINGEPAMSLPYGLTEVAIEAAKGMKFTPATKDGKPISVWVTITADFGYSDGAGCMGGGTEFIVMDDEGVKWHARKGDSVCI
ncbi:MAG: hypothetical protein QOJ64_4361 [Acidobacteriota bacterium]|jgi:hypothetical protein|nr:hypothetical protein [Acidobacteriota bacterium]